MKTAQSKLIKIALLTGSIFSASESFSQAVWSYDFNSQWNGTWSDRDLTGTGSIMNYSKGGEGRLGGAGGNELAGNFQAPPGASGSIASLYTPSTFDLSTTGSSVRLQESWSAFASQNSFAAGTSEVFQIGFLSNPGSNSTLTTGDSLYFGAIERSWADQSDSSPLLGTAALEFGIFKDGTLVTSLGTHSFNHYGARIGSEIYAQWLELDVLWENNGGGLLDYTIGVNSRTFYSPNVFTGPITEGPAQLVNIWSGSINPDLAGLSNLSLALGANIVAGGDVSVTGMTWDFSNADIISAIPEPSSLVMTAAVGLLGIRRRRQS